MQHPAPTRQKLADSTTIAPKVFSQSTSFTDVPSPSLLNLKGFIIGRLILKGLNTDDSHIIA